MQSKTSHKHYSGPALHVRGFTKSPNIDFCNYNYMHRCQSHHSIQIEGYNFTVWNRISKNECLKYENDTKKRENSFRKNSLTIIAFAKLKYLVYTQEFNSFVDILVMTFIPSPCKKCDLLGCAIHSDGLLPLLRPHVCCVQCVNQHNNREFGCVNTTTKTDYVTWVIMMT